MAESDRNNPFAALLSENGVEKGLVEEVFKLTLRKPSSSPPPTPPPQSRNNDDLALLCLADIIIEDKTTSPQMGNDLLAHMIFERLMLNGTREYLLPGREEEEALNCDGLLYLYRAHLTNQRILEEKRYNQSSHDVIHNLIVLNTTTVMRQPDLFPGRPLDEQWMTMLEMTTSGNPQQLEQIINFVAQAMDKIHEEDDAIEAEGVLKANYYPLLSKLQQRLGAANLGTIDNKIFDILSFFVKDKRLSQLGKILIDHSTPNPNATGRAYVETLFGQLFHISILPKLPSGPYDFFGDLTHDMRHVDSSIWKCLSNYQNSVFGVIKQLLLQSTDNKGRMMKWFGKCLYANRSRAHLWNNLYNGMENFSHENGSDAFMIGIAAILIRLCAPLCVPTLKVLLVDPTYNAVPEHDRETKCVSVVKVNEETCLQPLESNEDETATTTTSTNNNNTTTIINTEQVEGGGGGGGEMNDGQENNNNNNNNNNTNNNSVKGQRPTADSYNFVTDLFFLTHKAYELGYCVTIERLSRLTREVRNMQSAYQDVMNVNPQNELVKNIQRMLKELMQQYLCIRNCLLEPENDMGILKFFEATAIWLTEIISLNNDDEYKEMCLEKYFAPKIQRNRELPAQIQHVPQLLRCVPEKIIENIIAYLIFNRHLPPGQNIQLYPSSHDAFFNMIVYFMGNSRLASNPHLRAKLAEAMEFFVPTRSNGETFPTNVMDLHRHRWNLVPSLINVFVTIEMTGQSVQFEQKFNYRRPMYAIMEYLWTKREYVEFFRNMAEEAEANIEAIEPPLFLRFINLLINDAIFLLDESLNNLKQIRELQDAQDNGEWKDLPENERQQRISSLHHLGMLARFDNILGRDTINFLKLLTSEIKSIFCHSSMVDRITSMLNYFLLNLVGPQKEKFKVKDKKEFEFDPATTVLEICHIYINLSKSDAFCLAISQDGRSYSSQLFGYAESILIRIGGGQLIGEMAELADKVRIMEEQYKQEQEFVADAPEEYLDPIMSTLMTDPVILPSSKVTVDRTTIVRHLLSDQTDPFNRAPLTMDKVKPNSILKEQIVQWMANKRATAAAAAAASSSSPSCSNSLPMTSGVSQPNTAKDEADVS